MKSLNKNRFSKMALSLSLLIVVSFATQDALARAKEEAGSIPNSSSALPNPQQRVHRVSNVQACMTNWGIMGSMMEYQNESQGGCFNPHPNQELPAPSFEYPPESGFEYLFWGGLWIGGRINDTIYTSVATDGWFLINELWPDSGYTGAIKEGSVFPDTSCYSPDAISDQDIIAVYTDTSADIPLSPQPQDPWDNRPHHPLNVKVTQKSYSWAGEGWNKFIIVEYIVKNIGVKKLNDVYLGLYVDPDILHISEMPGPYSAWDDITGFLRVYKGDTVNIAWAADNDGHGIEGELTWTEFSPRGVMGVKVLQPPKPGLWFHYNWWTSHQLGHPKDWGPWRASNQDIWASMNPYGSGNLFPDYVLGTPGGDASKYFLMSNGEFDYDQIFSCVWPTWHPNEGWLPPSPECTDISNGRDIRFLLSFGPFDQLAPQENLNFAVAYVIGETLHVDPLNLYHDSTLSHPDNFYAKLNFGDLVKNALKAESLYRVISNLPPDSFSLLLPHNKDFTPKKVYFDWETATDPNMPDQVKYDLYVSTSYRFPPDSTTIDGNLEASEYTKTLDLGTYYWKVKAKDNRGGERWCNQTHYFMVTGFSALPLGDFNGDGFIDVGDVVFSINYLFKLGPAPDPLEVGDVNCDDVVDIGDVIFLINYLFKNGLSPSCP